MADWYRQQSWSKDVEEFFFQKLQRARKDSRAQYLKIQAIELVETGDDQTLNVAEMLINKIFVDYPDDKFNRSSALNTLGDIYRIREEYDKAIIYYKQAVDFEATYPRVKTQAYLFFAELVVKNQKTVFYEVVEQLLKSRIEEVIFPIEKYKACSILSIINFYKNNYVQAKQYADLAEQHVSESTSGLRYHKYLGVVKERDTWLDKLVRME